jgi:hypothetical protein
MKKSVKENKRKNSFTKKNKKSKSATLKNRNKIQKGGISYSIGVIKEKNNYVEKKTISENFNNLSNEIQTNQSLPILHITNLENAFTFPNKDPNFTYHSLFLSYIDGNINDLDVIKWTINKFLNDLLTEINKENNVNNENKVVYKINDLKINDFKFEFNLDKKAIMLSGNVYITNIKKLNNQLDNKLNNSLNEDANNYIKDFINPK